MALTIREIFAASFPAVLAEKNKPANQWSETALLRYMEKKGFIKREDLGATIETPLDYLINAGAEFLATDITATSLSKTEILGAASFPIAELSVPIVWTKRDEATNPSKVRKVNFVKGKIENGIASHDQLIERAMLAAAATQGFNSIPLLATEDGTGTVGGIVAGTDTFWKNQFDDYGGAEALLASFATVADATMKGSGSSHRPSLIVTSATSHGVFEGKLVANQRYSDAKEASGGFSNIKFRDADVVFSNEYSGDSYFFLSPKSLQLVVSKSHFRNQGETNEVDGANAYVTKIYSALQLVTNNRSRLGVSWT